MCTWNGGTAQHDRPRLGWVSGSSNQPAATGTQVVEAFTLLAMTSRMCGTPSVGSSCSQSSTTSQPPHAKLVRLRVMLLVLLDLQPNVSSSAGAAPTDTIRYLAEVISSAPRSVHACYATTASRFSRSSSSRPSRISIKLLAGSTEFAARIAISEVPSRAATPTATALPITPITRLRMPGNS